MRLIHITPADNLAQIAIEGLRPAVGPRSGTAKEATAAIWCFQSPESAADGLSNWLGEALDTAHEGAEPCDVAVLEIEVPDDSRVVSAEHAAGYEIGLLDAVPPKAFIRVMDEMAFMDSLGCNGAAQRIVERSRG